MDPPKQWDEAGGGDEVEKEGNVLKERPESGKTGRDFPALVLPLGRGTEGLKAGIFPRVAGVG